MNAYPSTEMAVATIVKNGSIIDAKYALAKIDVENNNDERLKKCRKD